jgi:uncharacterized cupredoxin-like copper-binding protein
VPNQLTDATSTTTVPSPIDEASKGPSQPTLTTVVDELRKQGASVRRTQQGFALFAAMALLLALVELIVIAAKLNDSNTMMTRTVTAPAATASAAAGTAAASGTAARGSASGSSGAAAALPHKIDDTLAEFSVTPSAPQAAAGKVTFAVQNSGKVTHEFVVLRTDKPAANLLQGARADESGNVGETGDLQPGQAKTISLKLPAGHYALICNLPGHYKAGQHTDFTVK